jgi:MFS family permease
MILIGLFSYVIICFVFGFVTDWVQLVVLRAVQGVASGSVWPVAIALIADLIPPEKRGSALGIYQAVGMGAYVSGPAVGGAILHYSRVYLGAGIIQSYQIPFYICGALSLVSVLLVSVFVKENFVQKQPNNNSFLTVLSSVPTKFRTTLYTVFVQAFSGGFSMGLIMSLTTIYVKDIFFSGCAQDEAYNLTTSWTASLFLAAGIAIVTSQLIAGKLSDMNGRKPLVVVGGVLSRFCIVAMAFSPNLWFLFLFGVL